MSVMAVPIFATRTYRAGKLALLLHFVIGCNDPPAKVAINTVVMSGARRDSAGVSIVEHTSLDAVPNLRLRAAELELGGLRSDSNAEFDARHPFLGAVRLSSREIVVNDFAALKFFTSKGDLLKVVGRRGSGPGEFSQTRDVCRYNADSLIVVDYSDGRVSIWSGQGEHFKTYSRPGTMMLGCPDHGFKVVQAFATAMRPDGATQASYSLRAADGSLVRELGVFAANQYLGSIWWEPSVLVHGDELLVADARAYELKVYDGVGHLRRAIRVTNALMPVKEVDWNNKLDAIGRQNANRPNVIARLESLRLHRPAFYPAYARVIVDGANRIWVEDYGKRTSWVVFESNGALLGRVDLDRPTSELATLDSMTAVVRWRDTDGALHLSFHRVDTLLPSLNRSRLSTSR